MTFPHLETVESQQPTLPEETVPHLDLELTGTPEPTVEAEHPTTMHANTAPPEHPEVTIPHPQPVQAQQQIFSDITVPLLDLRLTITPEPSLEAEYHTSLQPTKALLKHTEVTFTHPQSVQAQQVTFPGVTVPPLDLELIVTPEHTVEAEHPTALQPTAAPPKHPKVTFPHSWPLQAEEPTLSDVTVPPLNLELTITPELTVEAEHPTAPNPLQFL